MRRIILTLFALIVANTIFAQDYTRRWSADKGDGTYVNPIANGDFPDCDVIRVDSTFYFVSTTMYHFPGATILKSKDLVNWEYCANPLLQIENNDAYNLLNGGTHYAQGMWASSLNYSKGKFYLYFISYGRSGYDSGRNILLTATDPEGEWTMEYWPEHYYDAGWLFDDGENGDGNVYVACGIGDIWVNKLNGKTLAKISSTKVFSKDAHEGSHMYHIGDYYYIYITTGGYWKGQTILRSKDPMGPYEEVPYTLFQGDAVHQGALVDTPTGEWWTILFKDAGAIGRVPYLEPVQWVDGWPQIGKYSETEKRWTDVSKKGAKYKKPNVGKEYPKTYLPTNDAFASDKLGMQWAWNHNPQPDGWSLTERPGWMRLYSCTVTDNIMSARGSLTQRIMGYNAEGTASGSVTPSYGTVKLDISGMKEGDVAGLAVVQNPYSLIGVKMEGGKKYMISQRCKFDSQKVTVEEEKKGVEITADTIYLRAIVNFGTKECKYMYSTTATSGYKNWGTTMTMNYTLDVFVGQRFYIFNYSTKQTGGHVDIDWFTTETKAPVETFAQLDAEQVIVPEEKEVWTGFPFDADHFNPSIYGENTYSATMKRVSFKENTLAGWRYPEPWDISQFNYIVVNLTKKTTSAVELRIYDEANIWAEPYVVEFTNNKNAKVDLGNMVTASGHKLDPSHISIIAVSSAKAQDVYIKEAFLSDDGSTPTGINRIIGEEDSKAAVIYDLSGRKVNNPSHGIYIQNGIKVVK